MANKIVIQKITSEKLPINQIILKKWINVVLANQKHEKNFELCLRIVEPNEIQNLNQKYRKINKPTNVLAFPNSIPEYFLNKNIQFIGDIVICPQVLATEALAQNISIDSHWAHIIIHGILHLFGYDHQFDSDTAKMQGQEIALLAKIGYDNPYRQLGI